MLGCCWMGLAHPLRKGKTSRAVLDASSRRAVPDASSEYVFGKELGRGAFGVVYECQKVSSGQRYAIKVMDGKTMSPTMISQEVETLQLLQHPSIIRLHDVVDRLSDVCVVLQLYRGGSMTDGMQRHFRTKGAIPMTAVRHLTEQMWQAVAFLHSKSFVHCDVKGDNFMCDLHNIASPSNRIYLGDFGSVVQLERGSRLSEICGTRCYWSPENYEQNYGHKVDCWAVGVIMFALVSGNFPFKNQEEVKWKRPKVDARAGKEGRQLIQWALQRDETMRCEAAEAAAHPFSSGRRQPTVPLLHKLRDAITLRAPRPVQGENDDFLAHQWQGVAVEK